MGLIDSLKKSKEANKEQTTPPPAGHTLKQVLQDKNKSDLFYKLLRQDGNEDLANRLAEGKMDSGDLDLLEIERLAFSEKITRSEKVEKMLTKENVIDLARNHPEFEKLVNLGGPEEVIKGIKNRLRDIAITDEGRFNTILGRMEDKEAREEVHKKVEEKVEKLLESKNITPEEYTEALAIKDPIKKKEALRELSKRTNGGFKRAINFLSGGKWGKDSTLRELELNETLLEASIAELNAHQAEIANALFYSISENEEMRNSFIGEITNEKTQEKPEIGFREAKKGNFDEKEYNKAWEARKKAEKFSTKSTADQDAIRDAFTNEQKQEYKDKNDGKGLWVRAFEAFFENMIDRKKKELK